jgi:hypothetical protein
LKTILKSDAEFSKLGEVKGAQVVIDGEKWGTIATWKAKYDNALESVLNS